MARMSIPLFGGKRAAPAEAPPVPRKPALEQMLCEAIRAGMAVELRYQKPGEMPDQAFRSFGPDAVYHSEKRKVCVSGEQLGGRSSPHNFEVGRIVDLRVAAQRYQPSGTVDYSQSKYRNGIICRR